MHNAPSLIAAVHGSYCAVDPVVVSVDIILNRLTDNVIHPSFKEECGLWCPLLG
jgi:hypothetical protein